MTFDLLICVKLLLGTLKRYSSSYSSPALWRWRQDDELNVFSANARINQIFQFLSQLIGYSS